MNLSFKLLVAAAVFVASFAVGAQTIFSSSGYSTGEALEKPMVMKPFVEFSKARPLPELRIFTLDFECLGNLVYPLHPRDSSAD